ncbi:carbohydrate ABC transporter permease [Natronococcus pandeyae]|uniref:Carbohydrate ABC transporter permease n=1 Tax=Natronococcus pandeyae TaxID=2055836 RepID=A0A8J8PXA7_9EURY|nr:carbohydrate ABC transporter permease [Natronococcus pandeyae]TYL36170.1 carbohydrate ABC transporter permease [Natronococcus pandeyae]
MSANYTTRRRAVTGLRFGLLAVALVVFLFPFYWMFKTSVEPTDAVYGDVGLLPGGFTFTHYEQAFSVGFHESVINSLIVAIGTTVLTTVVALIGAFSILRYRYPGRGGAAKLVLLTYMFPHVALIVPVFYLAAQVGLLSSPIMLIAMHTMLALPFCMWILMAFLEDIPRELEEAALVEGASELGAFARITVPLSYPGIIAAGTFAFIMSWGEYMFAFVLMRESASHTVPVALHQLLGAYAIDWGLLAAVSIIATVPVLALFWLMAKYLGEGIAKGTGVV